jgi:hypothetical protein
MVVSNQSRSREAQRGRERRIRRIKPGNQPRGKNREIESFILFGILFGNLFGNLFGERSQLLAMRRRRDAGQGAE